MASERSRRVSAALCQFASHGLFGELFLALNEQRRVRLEDIGLLRCGTPAATTCRLHWQRSKARINVFRLRGDQNDRSSHPWWPGRIAVFRICPAEAGFGPIPR